MEYAINQLAKLSGVSTRTLRYYDQIGLLCPARISNGYRIYGAREVDLLQQILFYRALGVSLAEIGQILRAPDYDRAQSLRTHLSALQEKKRQIERMMEAVEQTIGTMKGETTMNDKEKFEWYKQTMVEENEAAYGKEIREKYGEALVDASNARVRGMSEAQWQRAQELSAQIGEALPAAMHTGDPSGALARELCAMHKEWLCLFWPEGTYSPAAHAALAEQYVADARMKAYYDAMEEGCAQFLCDAIKLYCA